MSIRDLSTATETEKKVFDFVRMFCARHATVERALLFGSRARGDHGDRSDFDIAIEAEEMSDDVWARFSLELREKVPTLCGLDLVQLNSKTSSALSDKIRQEGIELYGRK